MGHRDPVQGRGAIGIGGSVGTDENSGAEGVGVPYRPAGFVDAPSAARARAGLQRPGIARSDFDIDHAVAVGDRHDADLVEDPVRAHQALRLLDEARRDALAGPEQQLAPDDPGSRLNVYRVGGAVENAVFLLVREIEDVAVVDPHLADDRSGGLELGEGRDFRCGGPLGRSRRERASDHRAAAGEQPGEDRLDGFQPCLLCVIATPA